MWLKLSGLDYPTYPGFSHTLLSEGLLIQTRVVATRPATLLFGYCTVRRRHRAFMTLLKHGTGFKVIRLLADKFTDVTSKE